MTKSRPTLADMVAALLSAGIRVPDPQDATFIRAQYDLLCGPDQAGGSSPNVASVSSTDVASAPAPSTSAPPTSAPIQAVSIATVTTKASRVPSAASGAIPKTTAATTKTITTSAPSAAQGNDIPLPPPSLDYLRNMGRVTPSEPTDPASELAQLTAREELLQARIRVARLEAEAASASAPHRGFANEFQRRRQSTNRSMADRVPKCYGLIAGQR